MDLKLYHLECSDLKGAIKNLFIASTWNAHNYTVTHSAVKKSAHIGYLTYPQSQPTEAQQ